MPDSLDIIAVGAHPDDVEIAIGGTLAMLVKQGYRVGIVDLTDGEPTPGSPGPEVRLQEAAEAARLLGAERFTLTLPNRRLLDGVESRLALAKIFRQFRPRLVFGISGKTPLASPDHWQAMQITDAAVFYSRLTKWDAFDGLPVHTIARQLWYPLDLHGNHGPTDPGTFVFDISETLDVKLAAIRAYQTQFPPEKDRVFQMVEHQARYFGVAAGFAAGELLITPRAVGVRNLFGFLESAPAIPSVT